MKEYMELDAEGKSKFSKSYVDEVIQTLNWLPHSDITKVIEILEEGFMQWKKIFIAWNGWSAATASHMASDLQKTTLSKNPQTKTADNKFKAISLSDNTPVMTAWGNDEWYEYLFSEQLTALWEKDDVLVVITGSGNSKNIIQVVERAKEIWIKTIAFLWFTWWQVKNLVDQSILVDSTNYWPIEDAHMILVHLVTAYFKQQVQKRYE